MNKKATNPTDARWFADERGAWHSALFCVLVALLMTGCSNGNSKSPAIFGQDEQIFEQFELHGGQATLSWQLPLNGGTLVSGKDYFFYDSTAGLTQSPFTSGPQTETSSLVSLDGSLAVPAVAPRRVVFAGQVWLLPANASRRISYNNEGIREDDLASDGQTALTSRIYFALSETSLTGLMTNTPEELLAENPINEWVNLNNFQSNAKWLSGAAYMKKSGRVFGDTLYAQDCGNSTTVSRYDSTGTNPCQYWATLDNFFPVTLGIEDHPSETDFIADGTISTVQGVRTWIANAPLANDSSPTQEFRAFYELNGGVYQGVLQRDGTVIHTFQNDGSAVDYLITLNQQAITSVQRGLITGVVAGGSQVGNPDEVPTIDLFGIGGHGVNGALSPADLRSHYNVPTSLTGAGETIAIVNAPGTGNFPGDLNVFSEFYGLPQCNSANPCFEWIDLSNGAPVPTSADEGGEVALDLQVAHGIAPNAKIILVTAKTNRFWDLVDAINYAARLTGVTAVSLSYTLGGFESDQMKADSQLAELQSSLGMIFFACSGDDASVLGARYPASSPYVTGVGGTRINSVAWGSPATTEVAWEFSGGGANPNAATPTWQMSLLPAAIISANSGMRAVPDVAGNADPQHSAFAIYRTNHWGMAGGTSEATPLWAALSALLDQYLKAKGRSLSSMVAATPGGFNGLLYQMKLIQSGGFYDITSGSNNLTDASCDLCAAGPGYDDVTGLGVPDVTKLFEYFQ
jgi:Subtilase family